MASLIAGLISKTKLVVEKLSSLKANSEYTSRTVVNQITQVSRTKAAVERVSKLVNTVDYISRTALSSAIQAGRTKLEYAVGIFFTIFVKESVDSASVSDQISNQTGKNLFDTAILSDTTNLQLDYGRVQSDSAVATDDYLGLINIDDDIYLSIGKTFIESQSITDTATTEVVFNRDQIEGINTSDVVTQSTGFARPQAEVGIIYENINYIAEFTRIQNETSTLDDNTSVQFNKSVQESTTISGTISIYLENYFAEDYLDSPGYVGSLLLSETG